MAIIDIRYFAHISFRVYVYLKAEASCMWLYCASRQDIISRIQEYNLYKETPRDKLTTKEVNFYCFDNNSMQCTVLSLSLSLPLLHSLPLFILFLSTHLCVHTTIFCRSMVVFTLKVC